MIALRTYQVDALASARRLMAGGARAVLVVSPTGSGKGTMLAHTLARTAALGRRGLFVVHRRQLVQDIAARLRAAGVEHVGVAMGADSRDLDAPIVAGTVQTLTARGLGADVDIIVPDEAHHAVAETWRPLLSGRARVLGFTATPCRADGGALGVDSGGVFDRLVIGATVGDLTRAGHLVPCRVYAPAERASSLAARPVEAHAAYLRGRRVLWYARDRKHAERVAADLVASGVRAAAVDATHADRDARIARFIAGELDALVNVHLLTEGTDIPAVDGIGIARTIGHDGAWLQVLGRGLRPSPGKRDCVVVDLCGSAAEFGLPDWPRAWSLEGRPIRLLSEPDVAISQCAACGMVFRAHEWRDATCPGCGAVRRGKPDPRVVRARLEEVRGGHGTSERGAALHGLRLRARAAGYHRGWADRLFVARYPDGASAEDWAECRRLEREAGLAPTWATRRKSA